MCALMSCGFGKENSSLRPLKRSGGRRYYRPNDITLLRRIRKLLYVDGFTIKGAQKLIRSKASSEEFGIKGMMQEFNTQALTAAIAMLDEVKMRLAALKQKLASKKITPSYNWACIPFPIEKLICL